MRIRILSAESAGLVGFAKQKLAALRAVLPKDAVFTKRFSVGGITIFVSINPVEDVLTLFGGASLPNVMLSGVEGTFTYNYNDGKLTKVNSLEGELFQAGYMQIGQVVSSLENGLVYNVSSKTTSTEIPQYVDMVFCPSTGMCSFVDGNNVLYLQTGNSRFTPVAVFQNEEAGLESLHQNGNNVSILFSGRNAGWNYISSPSLWHGYITKLINNSIEEEYGEAYAWQWSSGISVVYNYRRIYYQEYLPVSVGTIGETYLDIQARFCTLLDSRDHNGGTPFGVAEMLERIDEKDKQEAYFTLNLAEPHPASYYRVEQMLTVAYGSTPPAYNNYLFSIDYASLSDEPPLFVFGEVLGETGSVEVLHWWSGAEGLHGVVARQGESFYVHRFFWPEDEELTSQVFSSSGVVIGRKPTARYVATGRKYKDASYSANGKIVAVLYDVLVNEVTVSKLCVIDLEKLELISDRQLGHVFDSMHLVLEYVEGETTAPIALEEESLRTELVPFSVPEDRVKDKEYSLYGFEHALSRNDGLHLGGWKITIQDRIANGFRWTDPCWQSIYTMHDSYENPSGSGPATDYTNLLSRWSYGHIDPLGVMTTTWHYITGGIGSWHTHAGGTVETPVDAGRPINSYNYERFGISFHYENNCIEVSGNTASPYNLTNTVDNNGCVVGAPYTCGDNDIVLTDACGEEYVLERELTPFFIGGPEDIYVGARYTGVGGLNPKSYSISCGEIGEQNGTVVSLDGCCGSATVTATHACGSDSMKVRVDIGLWVLVQDSAPRPSEYIANTQISGDTKTERVYIPAGAVYSSTEMLVAEIGCIPSVDREDECSGQIATCTEICGWTAGIADVSSLEGTTTFVTPSPEVAQWCATTLVGHATAYIGARCWAINSSYTRVWRWECP